MGYDLLSKWSTSRQLVNVETREFRCCTSSSTPGPSRSSRTRGRAAPLMPSTPCLRRRAVPPHETLVVEE